LRFQHKGALKRVWADVEFLTFSIQRSGARRRISLASMALRSTSRRGGVARMLPLVRNDSWRLEQRVALGGRAHGKKTAMSNIVRDSEVCELTAPPFFSFGEKVKAKRTIRNDGTYAGKEIGEVLAKKGEEGYVVSIGTFLQQFYIYGVEFTESGNRVGMKRKELDSANPRDDVDLPLP